MGDRRRQILLVEDEGPLRRAMEFKLTRAGYDVASAGRGEDAWYRALRGLVDLVITGECIPGTNGVELVRRLGEDPRTRGIPVIVVGFERYVKRWPLEDLPNVVGVIYERFSLKEVIARISEVLGDDVENGSPAGTGQGDQGARRSAPVGWDGGGAKPGVDVPRAGAAGSESEWH